MSPCHVMSCHTLTPLYASAPSLPICNLTAPPPVSLSAAVLVDTPSAAAAAAAAIYEDSEPLPYGTHFIDESVLAQGKDKNKDKDKDTAMLCYQHT